MKKILLGSLALLSLLLVGCHDDAAYKKTIQDAYDRGNPYQDTAFCLLIGYNNHYPYTTVNLTEETAKSRFEYLTNMDLNQRLKIFTRLGLFTQTLIDDGRNEPNQEPIYRYELTDMGKRDVAVWKDSTGACFGRRVIEEITDYRDATDGSELMYVDFTYSIEGIPEWAKDPEIIKIYGTMAGGHTYTDGSISDGSLMFRPFADEWQPTGRTGTILYR